VSIDTGMEQSAKYLPFKFTPVKIYNSTHRPLDLETMCPAIIFCLEYFTERFEANLFLLQTSSTSMLMLPLPYLTETI
jgi:hypothetical protein